MAETGVTLEWLLQSYTAPRRFGRCSQQTLSANNAKTTERTVMDSFRCAVGLDFRTFVTPDNLLPTAYLVGITGIGVGING